MGDPRATASPAATEGSTGSYVVRRPPAWSMLTTGRPATIPANATTPSPAASTEAPGAAARSTPRCPGPNGPAGASNARVTGGDPGSGHAHCAPGTAAGGSATAG